MAYSARAEMTFKKTLEQIAAGELYPLCPRCMGERTISVCTDPGGDFRPSRWEYVSCPECHATGEADAERAASYIADWDARHGEDA